MGARGPERGFDERDLLERIQSVQDLWAIQQSLIANGEQPLSSGSCIRYLDQLQAGDPTGGGVHPRTARRYRAMLARLPEIPLPPAKPGRRRTGTRGSANVLLMVATTAGAGALAWATRDPHMAAHHTALFLAPIMPEQPDGAVAPEIPGRVVALSATSPTGIPECVPGARHEGIAARIGYASELELAA